MKKSKFRIACLIVIGLYILSSIYLGVRAYQYHTSEHPPLMAIGYDTLFIINTQIHIAIFMVVVVCNILYKLLLKWIDN